MIHPEPSYVDMEKILQTLQLPPAPAEQSGPVKIWQSDVIIPTWEPLPGERNPMFLEKRVYQGSSGRVYPLPFIDRIAETPVDHSWKAVHIENEYIRVMILPELGGRIHVARDKTNGYDFVYRQDVIKPALVGLAGPWISGGIEFNWPQHHRPGTYLPVESKIETEEDGACVVWLSAQDPLSRLKGMHGICLRPGKAIVELRVRLYNPTSLSQTFLWWANLAAEVNESFQSFFPEDVGMVADHAKRATSTFPLSDGLYYGVDYGARAHSGVPENEKPRLFCPDGHYAPNDLSWYANIPVPTSYMCAKSKHGFFGGYDHKAEAGVVHIANAHLSPGKKQWTWGNHEFGYAWDRQLTVPDANGVYRPYIELMAGVFTDNQPDFSFLAPGETRTFSQYWYPIQKIGTAQEANSEAAVSVKVADRKAIIGVASTQLRCDSTIELFHGTDRLAQWRLDLSPESPFITEILLPENFERNRLLLRVAEASGKPLIVYRPDTPNPANAPEAATEPPAPSDIASSDELYFTGLHLEQYRHATRDPDIYWQEAVKRDPLDARCNNALGLWHLRRGEFSIAEDHFKQSIKRSTVRNPNPYDSESFHNLGVCLRYLQRDNEAYDLFYKATWSAAWRAAAFLAIAEIDITRREWATALSHLNESLRHDIENLRARNLKAICLQYLGLTSEKDALIAETIALDPLDCWSRLLAGLPLECDTQSRIDIAISYMRSGLLTEAENVLSRCIADGDPGTRPILYYYLAAVGERQGQHFSACKYRELASSAPRDYCFPVRLEEQIVLQDALVHNDQDAAAHYYLGNLLYDKRRHQEAIRHWERSAVLGAGFATVWRNLGIARFNILGNAASARIAYEQAFQNDRSDARVLYERDQLWKRIGVAPLERLAELQKYRTLVNSRDDLTIELCALLNHTGEHAAALELLQGRRFQPWEGGEGLVLGQYIRTCLAMGRSALKHDAPESAVKCIEAALNPPENLGENRHMLANPSEVLYWLGQALAAAGRQDEASEVWESAASFRGDFQLMSVRAYSEMSYFSARALDALGRKHEATLLMEAAISYAEGLLENEAKIDYFATSLPTMLLFDENLQLRQQVSAYLIMAQAFHGLGYTDEAQRRLKQVLELDPNNAVAIDFSEAFVAGSCP